MKPLDYKIAIGVFLATTAMEGLTTLWAVYIGEGRNFAAANAISVTYFLQGMTILSLQLDWRYLFPIALGGWVGTIAALTVNQW